MAIIRKYETVTDLRVYEVELTEDQLKVYLLDNDRFCDDIEGDFKDRVIKDPSSIPWRLGKWY